MNLGINLSLGSWRPSGASGGPTSVIDTSDFSAINPTHAEIIDADSFRLCRDAALNGQFLASVPPGNYRVRGTLLAYDGAVPGITGIALRVSDNTTARFAGTAAGAFDTGTISIASGFIRFLTNAIGNGARLDGLLVEAVA